VYVALSELPREFVQLPRLDLLARIHASRNPVHLAECTPQSFLIDARLELRAIQLVGAEQCNGLPGRT
jgi:hypothetical protein